MLLVPNWAGLEEKKHVCVFVHVCMPTTGHWRQSADGKLKCCRTSPSILPLQVSCPTTVGHFLTMQLHLLQIAQMQWQEWLGFCVCNQVDWWTSTHLHRWDALLLVSNSSDMHGHDKWADHCEIHQGKCPVTLLSEKMFRLLLNCKNQLCISDFVFANMILWFVSSDHPESPAFQDHCLARMDVTEK